MDTKSSTVVSNQEDELQYEMTGSQNNEKVTDISNFSNTPVSDIEAPLSPVLTNDKKSLRHIARRKSRIKLLSKFSQSSEASQESFTSFTSLQFDTQTLLEDEEQLSTVNSVEAPAETLNNVKLDTEKSKSNDDRELEERMKRCLEMQRNRKFCYNIANSSSVSLPKPENKISEEQISKIKSNESFVSNVIITDSKNVSDFNFKIPESPVSQSKLKKQNKRASLEFVSLKIEPDLNLKVGFETGSGKKINLSEKALKRAAKIFDDIIEIPCESENVLKSNENTEEKAEISLNNIGFKTAGGNNLKLSESSLKKVQTLFDDIFDLSNYNETNIKKNNSTTSTSTEVVLSNSFDQDVQNLFSDSFESENNTNFPTNKQETQFKLPTQAVEKLPNKIEEISPKHVFSQITDTQMCLAAENAECLVEFMDSQWTPSPKNKSPLQRKPQLVENNLNKSQEDFDELSPEAEQLFGNLTVREDGTVTNRNTDQESIDNNIDHVENLSTFESSTPLEKHSTKPEMSVKETRNVSEENNENISSVGFSTASGKNISISEESLKKAKQVFQDCDVIEEKIPKDEENFHKDFEASENVSLGFATASGKTIVISDESLKKAKQVFQDCDVNEENLATPKDVFFGFATASGKEITISDESLKKAQTLFEDCDIEDKKMCDDPGNTPVCKNVTKLELSPKKVEQTFKDCNTHNNKSNESSEKVVETFEEVAELEESHIQVKNISNDCNIEKVTESQIKTKIISDINVNPINENYPLKNHEQTENKNGKVLCTTENILNAELFPDNSEKETLSSEQDKSSEQSTEELFFTAEKEDAESSNCCGFIWEEALKSLKIFELYKRSFKYIEKDLKNNLFYPLNCTFNDIQSSKEYKNKNYKYFLRSRRRSNTIYSSKKSKTSRKSINKSPNVSELLSTSIRITRSKKDFVCDDSFAIENSLPKSRSRKRLSNTDTNKESPGIDEKCIKHTAENKNKVKSDIKQTIQSLEDAFLSSIENSFNTTDNFASCESNISKEENLSCTSLQKNNIDCKQNRNINETINSLVSKSENMINENIAKIDTKRDLVKNLNKTTKTLVHCDTIKDEETLHKNMETPKNITSFGFATASGKKVSISEESLKKAKNIFEDCDVTEEILHKKVETPKSLASFGFASASGKKVTISEESLKKAKNIFKDCDIVEENFDNSIDTPKNISSFGFETASGKKVTISEESLKKAKTIFEDCDVTEEILHKEAETPKSLSSFGFASASGKKVTISEESLKKAKKIFEDCDVTEGNNENVYTPKNITSFGFATASGKIVNISEESLKKAKDIFEDCNVTEEIIQKEVYTPKNISSFGFATASGKEVTISEESLKKAKNIFEDSDITEEILKKEVETPKNVSSFAFATASGKKVAISEESLKKAKNIFEDCDVSEEILHKNLETPKSISSFGFATASGKKVAISEESLKKAKNIFEDCDITEEIKSIETPKYTSSFGFTTASGKEVQISEDALDKARTMFDDDLVDTEQSSEDIPYSYTSDESQLNVPTKTGFSTASGNKVNISEEALNKVKNIFDDVENIEAENPSKRTRHISESCENNLNSLNTPKGTLKQQEKIVSVTKIAQKATSSPALTSNKSYSSPNVSSNNSTPILRTKTLSARNSKKRSLGVSSCRQIDIAENNLKRAKLIFDDDIPKKQQVIINNNNLVNYSPIANKTNTPVINTPKNVTPVSTPNKYLLNSSMSMKESNQIRCSQNLSTPKISPLKKLCIGYETMQENSSFVFREKTAEDKQKWNADLQKELELVKLKMSVFETRILMLNEQREIIETGSSDHRRQRPGSLFSQKSNNETRISLQKAVCHRRPNKNTHQVCLNMGLDSSILNITSENSSSLHFHVRWWPNDNRTYPAVIRTEDGAIIVPNSQNYVGITEIEQAFLAMPGVDPSLVPKNWVPNHYRWIVWKLASLERNYPDVFKSYLGVENVMNQLKYRYDREIDRAQRPAIRKIVECDDTAAKRMVLCVATVFKLENKYELELTDGWYSIKTTLDTPLNLLVERNIIKVGMKLVTQGAELLNCEGCCPLELPANVRLQIHYNSTRRAAWHLKLGYQPNPGPLRIALRMISGNGGPVGGVSAYVARVYPISFMERTDVTITWRNQRAELRRANQWEAAYANTMENMQMKLQMELEKEWGERAKKNKNHKLKIKDVKGVHCGKTLFQFMEDSNDPDSVEELLTPAQISALQNYQTELNMERQAELSAKLRERLTNQKLQPRNVSTVLKLLLVDVQSPYHHRMLSVWIPTESHTQLLKEEIVVNIYNVTAKNNGTLSTIPRTQFEEDLGFDTTKFENLTRFVLPISQTSNPELKPFFGEFDTVGMVVTIDVQQTAQSMWIADENFRFLLIKIREGPETCVLFDGLTPGNKIAVLNLIYQKPFKNYGESIGNHYTVISSYPQQMHLQDFMNEFSDSLPQDVDRYLEECKNIVEEFSSHSLKRAYVLNPLNINNSEEAKETLSKKLCGVENTQQNKSDSLTLSDEEMALIDTQIM